MGVGGGLPVGVRAVAGMHDAGRRGTQAIVGDREYRERGVRVAVGIGAVVVGDEQEAAIGREAGMAGLVAERLLLAEAA